MSEHETELLGAYVLGVLETDDQAKLQEHLAGCEHCRQEVDDLREMEAALGEIPPEAFIDGPPEDGDLLLQRTLREVRGERARGDWQRRAVWAAAAVVVGAAVLGGGALIGRSTGPSTVAAPAPSVSAAPTLAPNTRTASATDPATGAAMTVALQPAAGWVRVHVAVSGVAAGQQCRLIVVAKDGSRREAGSWVVSPAAATAGTTLDSAALVAPADVAEVQVETFAGQPLVSVPI
jgi:hypothetical protein